MNRGDWVSDLMPFLLSGVIFAIVFLTFAALAAGASRALVQNRRHVSTVGRIVRITLAVIPAFVWAACVYGLCLIVPFLTTGWFLSRSPNPHWTAQSLALPLGMALIGAILIIRKIWRYYLVTAPLMRVSRLEHVPVAQLTLAEVITLLNEAKKQKAVR
jgi:hypothetical protein